MFQLKCLDKLQDLSIYFTNINGSNSRLTFTIGV